MFLVHKVEKGDGESMAFAKLAEYCYMKFGKRGIY